MHEPISRFLDRPGAILRFIDIGSGRPVLFQHGLGGSAAQTAEAFPRRAGRCLTLECRAHGGSESGPLDQLSIAAFADDVLALADAMRIERFVAGGISMGAAIALRLAALHPDRVEALVLVRPAWLFAPAPPGMAVFATVAGLMRDDPRAGRGVFAESDIARHLSRVAPDNLASLLGFFEYPRPEITAALLARIAADGPGVGADAIRAPALVVGNAQDRVHPLALAQALAAVLPAARFVEVAAKAAGRAAHLDELHHAIADFLDAIPHTLPGTPSWPTSRPCPPTGCSPNCRSGRPT